MTPTNLFTPRVPTPSLCVPVRLVDTSSFLHESLLLLPVKRSTVSLVVLSTTTSLDFRGSLCSPRLKYDYFCTTDRLLTLEMSRRFVKVHSANVFHSRRGVPLRCQWDVVWETRSQDGLPCLPPHVGVRPVVRTFVSAGPCPCPRNSISCDNPVVRIVETSHLTWCRSDA